MLSVYKDADLYTYIFCIYTMYAYVCLSVHVSIAEMVYLEQGEELTCALVSIIKHDEPTTRLRDLLTTCIRIYR